MSVGDEALPRLQARIGNLEHLREPVRAMRALAAARLQEAQTALPGSRSYVAMAEAAIVQAATLCEPPAGTAAPTAAAVVAVGSEHGFAGGFNDRVLDRAEAEAARLRAAIGLIGGRAGRIAEERGIEIAWCMPMANHVSGAAAVARGAAQHLLGAAQVVLVFACHRSGGAPEVRCRQILPLPHDLLRRGGGTAPLHHLPAMLLLERLAGEYLFAVLADGIVESFAAENAARLQAMEAADRNIGERLEALQRRERSLRQEAVTAELLDVVTGELAILD